MPAVPEADGRNFLDPKVLTRIARLEVRARTVVEGFVSGLHRSPYHGLSVEFASHREYVPGDETKHIDWKVWARADRLYVKQYEEETNLRATLLVDASRSMRYGGADGGMSKFTYACTVAASLAYLLHLQQDAVGLVTFDTAVRRSLPPSSHPSHLKLLLHELAGTEPDNRTDVAEVFHRLAEEITRRGLVVLVSDLLLDLGSLTRALQHFRHKRHEVVVFQVLHEDELVFPFQDNTMFRGLEVEQQILTEPRALRKAYLEALDGFLGRVRRTCADLGIDYMLMSTHDPLDAALASYLAFRRRKARAVLKR
ncbi:MAG: DUF58 domain-containing protein [Planctomycetes bacterium]|nr:DUF58 domain-containing protein [Planctomycetota bacterium]